jgi:tyrosine-protein kinase Etk/Wzc
LDQLTYTVNSERVQENCISRTDELMDLEYSTAKDGINLLDLLLLLAKHKITIVRFVLGGAILGVLVSLCMPDVYSARTTLLPPQQQSSLVSSFLGQLGPMSAIAGKDAIKNPSELMLTVLQSRTVADAIINRFDLGNVYRLKLRSDVRDRLEAKMTVSSGKDGVVTLQVEDSDPQRAANIANQCVAELYSVMQSLALTEASQRRRFFEAELVKAREDLALAEVGMRRTQEGTGLIKLDDQAKAIIEAAGRVQAEIATIEVSLRAMRTFATDNNPDMLRTKQELEGLRAQLYLLENAQVSGKGRVLLPTSRVPEAGMEYARKLRELKYREAVYELLVKQYETARIEEAKSPALIQVIDKAELPEKRSSPRRLLMAMAFAAFGMMISIALAIVVEWGERNPTQRMKAQQVLRNLATGWNIGDAK